jgi:hypothetical protein
LADRAYISRVGRAARRPAAARPPIRGERADRLPCALGVRRALRRRSRRLSARHATTLGYVVAAAGGWLAGTFAAALEADPGVAGLCGSRLLPRVSVAATVKIELLDETGREAQEPPPRTRRVSLLRRAPPQRVRRAEVRPPAGRARRYQRVTEGHPRLRSIVPVLDEAVIAEWLACHSRDASSTAAPAPDPTELRTPRVH